MLRPRRDVEANVDDETSRNGLGLESPATIIRKELWQTVSGLTLICYFNHESTPIKANETKFSCPMHRYRNHLIKPLVLPRISRVSLPLFAVGFFRMR